MQRAEDAGPATVELAPGLMRVRAPNPSPMTFTGTNTYILGSPDASGDVAVIDPGPALPRHLDAILDAIGGARGVATILVTHSHGDHSGLAPRLAAETGAPIVAAGASDWGRSPVMASLAATTGLGGGEGIDASFVPDRQVRHGDRLTGEWGEIEVLETPGHMANHLSFAWQGNLFCGDTVMGWSTSLVSPPDGDMTAFMATLALLAGRSDRVYYPGHGEPITRPSERVAELAAHRRDREAQILEALETCGASTAEDLAQTIYSDLAPALLPAAARNVLAHLIDLVQRSMVEVDGPIAEHATFRVPPSA